MRNQIRLPQVSIIIPAYDRKDDVVGCLTSVVNLNYPSCEIVVVDNASTDGLDKAIRKFFPEVKLIPSDKNLGTTGGRNLGLEYISKNSEYVLFLDHDIIVQRDMLLRLVEMVVSDSKIGIATPKIYYHENMNKIWSAGTSINLLTGKISFRGNEIDHGQFDEIVDVQVAPAVILVKKEVIEKIGGFDEVYFTTYEDTDFCFRVRESGYRVVYVPEAKAYHKIPSRWSKSMNRLFSRTYYVGRNRIIFMKKHSNHFTLFLLFLPGYLFYYSSFSLFFGKLEGVKNFWKGTFSGLVFVARK